MHTYLKRDDGYDVGVWTASAFCPLFKVAHLHMALMAVNILSGGTGDATITTLTQGIVKEIE